MKKVNRPVMIVIFLFFCGGVIFGVKTAVHYLNQDLNLTILARSKGDPNAPIKIVEFIDFPCEPCALGAEYLNAFMEEHPGTVRLEVRYYPLVMHQHAMVSARYAECAARQDKFWPFHNSLFQRQKQWVNLKNISGIFNLLAKEANLDLKKLKVCLRDQAVDAVIKNNKREGKSIEVMATPTFFVNEQKIIGKAELEPGLNRLLKKIGK